MSSKSGKPKRPQTSFKGVPSFTDADLEDDNEAIEDEEELEVDYDDDDYDEDFDDADGDDDPEDEIPVDEDAPDNSKLLNLDEDDPDDDSKEERWEIPEWKSHVIIRGLTKSEFDNIRRMSRTRAPQGRSGKRGPARSGTNRAVMEREIFIAGVVSPEFDQAAYNRLCERPGSVGVIFKVTRRIAQKSGIADDEEEKREKRFPRK